VAKQIRNGSPQMPSFGTTLKDADIADLLAYLHDGCCYEETKPPVNPWYRASAQNSPLVPERGNLRGGPRGTVRSAGGDLLEGIMVQLIAPNAVRTTVTTNQDGQYEFPQLLPGSYALRGEVWAGELHGGRMLRFNPAADHWTEYVLPEPYSHDRRTWIDNSTTPVMVWYVDHNSYLVRVQARE